MENRAQNLQQNNNGNDQVQVESSSIQQMPSDTGSPVVRRHNNNRKLFVGGLTVETTERDIVDYFKKFGSIECASVQKDRDTGRSRGFGFIVFNDAETVAQVIAAGEHVINNRRVDPQVAKVRSGKIFVGGIADEISREDVRSHFSQFGNVAGIEMPFDKTKNRHKNYCFLIFESEVVARNVLQNPKQYIKNKMVSIKRAAAKVSQEDKQRFFPQSNAGAFGQNWGQLHSDQTYYGGYSSNNQQGTFRGHNASYTGTGYEASTGYQSYVNNDQYTENESYDQYNANSRYGASTSGGGNRGGSRGSPHMSRGRGTSWGKSNRFQPF